jgi:MFS family permease
MSTETAAGRAEVPGRSPLLFIFLTVFIDLLGFGIVIPLLPIYSKAFAMSELELGLLFSCFSGMQFLFAPMWGRLSDRIGRKPVLVGGLVGTAAAYLLFARAESAPMLYASRLLAGFFGANLAAAQAFIADVTDAKSRAKGMGLLGAAFGLGFTFGPLMGGELSARSLGWVGDRFALPGYAAAAFSFAAAAFGAFTLREPERRAGGSREFCGGHVKRALGDRRIGTLMALNFLNIFAFACFEAMFTRFGLALFPTWFDQPEAIAQPSLDEVMKAAPVAGRYLFAVGILSALVQGGFIRRLIPKYGELRLAVVGPAILGISLGIIGGAPTFAVVIAGCVLMPFGFGLTNPSVAGLLSRAVPEEEQGAFLGINQSGGSLARMTGPAAAGALFLIEPRLPFFAATAILLGTALIAARYRARYAATFAAHG